MMTAESCATRDHVDARRGVARREPEFAHIGQLPGECNNRDPGALHDVQGTRGAESAVTVEDESDLGRSRRHVTSLSDEGISRLTVCDELCLGSVPTRFFLADNPRPRARQQVFDDVGSRTEFHRIGFAGKHGKTMNG